MEDKDIQDVSHFLLKNEVYCISLIQSLIDKSSYIYIIGQRKIPEQIQIIKGIIAISKGGSILHCLPKLSLPESIQDKIAQTISKHPIFSVNGEESGSEFLISLIQSKLNKKYKVKNTYRLLTKKNMQPVENTKTSSLIKKNIIFRQCTSSDLKFLTPLEEAYQIEEVIPPGQSVNKSVFPYVLTKQLNKKCLFAAVSINNEYLAKCAASAFSWNYAQLGGIYTKPEYRNQGIAFQLLETMISYLFQQKKKCALFVKTSNKAAKALYKKSGFENLKSYIIAYY